MFTLQNPICPTTETSNSIQEDRASKDVELVGIKEVWESFEHHSQLLIIQINYL